MISRRSVSMNGQEIFSRFALLALIPALQGSEGSLGQKVGMDSLGPEKAEIQQPGLVSTRP